jgi:hypothetical protein
MYAAAAIAILILAEFAAGRRWGTFALTAPNSRGLVDVYTLSQVIHGFVFYATFGSLAWAVIAECVWEVIENSPLVIDRYRQTASVDYQGDTILNSLSDVLSMAAGYYAACFGPAWLILSAVVAFELFGLWWCRDNLPLNVLMLVYPSERIKAWQQSR